MEFLFSHQHALLGQFGRWAGLGFSAASAAQTKWENSLLLQAVLFCHTQWLLENPEL